MKKNLLLTTLLIAMTIKVNAQIPNSGFENWQTVGSYEDPTSWKTTNSISNSFYSCQKSADPFPVSIGNYCIKLTNNTSLTQMTGGWGMAATKNLDYPFKPAFPITGHPVSLTGYYKYVSLNADSMWIQIVLFNAGTIVAMNEFATGVN